MKFLSSTFIVFLSIVIMTSCKSSKSSNSQNEVISVKLTLTLTSEYCGGAAPPEILLKQLRQPKPLKNKELFYLIKGGSFENAIKIKSDEKGIIELNLIPGEYNLFFPEKLTSTPSRPYYKEICEKWKNTPNGTFILTKEQSNVTTNISRTCNGCYDPAA